MFHLSPQWQPKHPGTQYLSKKKSYCFFFAWFNFHELFLFFFSRCCLLPHLHSDLNRKAKSVKDYKAKIELLGSYDPQNQHIIKDPYYVSIGERNSQVEHFQA